MRTAKPNKQINMKTSTLQSLLAATGLFFGPYQLWAQTPSGTATGEQQNKEAAERRSGSTTAAPATPAPASTSPQNADVSQSAKEQFTLLDLDRDNKVTREEFARFSDTDPNPARDASSSTGVGKNGTGPGTAGSTTGSTGGVIGRSNDADRENVKPRSHEERFAELDINKDGSLNIEEFARVRPANIDAGRDASSSTGVGKNGTGPGTAGSTTGSTEASTENLNGKEKR